MAFLCAGKYVWEEVPLDLVPFLYSLPWRYQHYLNAENDTRDMLIALATPNRLASYAYNILIPLSRRYHRHMLNRLYVQNRLGIRSCFTAEEHEHMHSCTLPVRRIMLPIVNGVILPSPSVD